MSPDQKDNRRSSEPAVILFLFYNFRNAFQLWIWFCACWSVFPSAASRSRGSVPTARGQKFNIFSRHRGISMSSLALLTHRRGLRVGGYDRTRSEVTGRLESAGILVHDTPAPSHLDGFEAVVYTVAIAEDHPEYVEAVRRGLPQGIAIQFYSL